LALAVGITPEALPVILTITLSNGALAMAKEKVITKRLASIEDLGNIDLLCCDKTGTLTDGKLNLINGFDLQGLPDPKIILKGLLCNSVKEGGLATSENPVDKAIWESPWAGQLLNQVKEYNLIDENAFGFARRRMSVVVKKDNQYLFLVKGAPESVLAACNSAKLAYKKTPLNPKLVSAINQKITNYQKEGYTVIALAEKATPHKETSKEEEQNLTFLGFLVFLDPPKPTAQQALVTFAKLKVAVKILSGDSPITTRKICQEVGFNILKDKIITGEELEKVKEAEFTELCHQYNVFSRITPEQKFKIVKKLNYEGHIVGFLGDGINDAPALKAADVGISVDSGATIAKEAADIILLTKSLNVLASGITEGRKTFGNITKYILNTISANWGNMFTVALSSLFMNFIPLLPSQILLNNFVSDTPHVAISTDNVDEEFLKKPKRWNLDLIFQFMIYFGLISSFYDLCLILPLLFLFKSATPIFRTAWFLESALSEIVSTFAIRSKFPFYESDPSKLLVLTSFLAGLLAIIITYTPLGFVLFQFEKLPFLILVWIAGILLAYFFSLEIAKKFFFKKFEI